MSIAMKPARAETRGEDCYGLPSEKYRFGGGATCGRKVEFRCLRCGVHRCRECCGVGEWNVPTCPMCAITSPGRSFRPGVLA